ncbi:type II toxin-antitoxin system VapC family toxin [Rhodomicrobium lacus]|uniref:type II toxin-antitoxin system VapC family toxin n=1 Tax=Rhodomicrobium lacus TaxID=2498452 RepID=UPI0026E22783|nr:type II toxin-antitoxin system VapC family toxin [Rhodomicrobium lacus]WKW49499.1 type II toxin-antitoxin system VapC family toxin [Rhodomicrobium lacus]
MQYLLDTNIVSDIVRNPKGLVRNRIRQVGQTNVCTSILVACEARYGAAKRNSPELNRQLELILATIDILPFEAPADTTYAALRSNLEREGRLIGNNDLFIAAHALTLGCTLVTANEREFARIDGLLCENWLRS